MDPPVTEEEASLWNASAMENDELVTETESLEEKKDNVKKDQDFACDTSKGIDNESQTENSTVVDNEESSEEMAEKETDDEWKTMGYSSRPFMVPLRTVPYYKVESRRSELYRHHGIEMDEYGEPVEKVLPSVEEDSSSDSTDDWMD